MAEGHRGEQVDVDVADASPHEGAALDEFQRFAFAGDGGWQIVEQSQDFAAILQVPAGPGAGDPLDLPALRAGYYL